MAKRVVRPNVVRRETADVHFEELKNCECLRQGRDCSLMWRAHPVLTAKTGNFHEVLGERNADGNATLVSMWLPFFEYPLT